MYIIVFVDTKNRRLQMTNLTELETAMVEKMGAESSYEDAECTKCDNTLFSSITRNGDPRVARGVFASLSQKGLTFTWDNSSNGDPKVQYPLWLNRRWYRRLLQFNKRKRGVRGQPLLPLGVKNDK